MEHDSVAESGHLNLVHMTSCWAPSCEGEILSGGRGGCTGNLLLKVEVLEQISARRLRGSGSLAL